ncbi:MAG: RagB/SusD family nutrient uptake outer membrane protein [Chlorobi bacterium]|nr:RagB/SusD family nutrient uptake outer membrane protein [Chlorobiota bacterium]
MKIYIFNAISVLLIFFTFASCEKFLEEVPKKELSPANAFKTAQDAELIVIGCYDPLQAEAISQGEALFKPNDIMKNIKDIYMPFPDNGYLRDHWRSRYFGINACNTALDHIPDIEMDDERKNELLSEVLWIRSFLYFGLVREFVNIPMPLHETTDLANVNIPQVAPDTIYAQIIKDLKFALQHLAPQSEKDYGRVTKGAAQALLSKVYLTLGSLEKRDGKGDGKAYFQKCAELSKQIIDSHEYGLVPYFPDVFHYKNENNEEVIFAVKYTSGGINEGNSIILRAGIGGGLPSSKGGSWRSIQATVYFSTIWEESDSIRKDWSVVHVLYDKAKDLLYKTDDTNSYPYCLGKYRGWPTPENYNKWDEEVDVIIFRYGEVLLNYAEALNEINNGPNSEVFWALNKIRERARYVNGDHTVLLDVFPREYRYVAENVPDLTPADYPDYQSIFDYLVLERARELSSENKRWFDLTRWGLLYERMKWIAYTDDGKAYPATFPEEIGNYKANVELSKYPYYAIPVSEIESNPNLIQNTGY